MNRIARRTSITALVLAPIVALLVACAPTPTPAPAPAPVSPAEPSTPAAPANTPVDFSCAEALPAVSGWAAASGITPDASSNFGQALTLGGIACESTNSNGNTVQFSVALPSSDELKSIQQKAAEAGTLTTALGGQQGYFSVTDGTGDAEVFAGGYWISAQSASFAGDTDAAPIVEQIINVLPAG